MDTKVSQSRRVVGRCFASTPAETLEVELADLVSEPEVSADERAVLEGGIRTSTLTAVTRCRVAIAAAADIDRDALHQISLGHRREDAPR